MKMRVLLVLVLVWALPAAAQDSPRRQAMATWLALDVPSGYETRLTPAIASSLPGWASDRWGNMVRRVGSGTPRRLVACALDRPALAVTQITDDGYLRVHRIGRGSRHPLWDQQFEAQPVRILTRRGPVAGVVARVNDHFASQHRDDTAVVTADDLWVDVGAESAEGVAALGIELLDPLVRHLPAWSFAGEVAGPDAGRRVGCAAVATLAAMAADAGMATGETVFVLSAQEVFGWVGLSSLVAREAPFDSITVLAPGQAERAEETRTAETLGGLGAVLAGSGVAVSWLVPAVRDPGAHMERITLAEADLLLGGAAARLGIALEQGGPWVAAPPPPPLRRDRADDAHGHLAGLLTALVETPGVSGHEWAVRRRVLEAMPEWAREGAVVDDMGNVFVEMGPEGPATVFMAHLDETGYLVESIEESGVVHLRGSRSSAWEGQTALLHFDPEGAPSLATGTGDDTSPRWKAASLAATAPMPLRGVFLARSDPDQKRPTDMRAWFGLDSAGLAARGVRPGLSVASHKEGIRLGEARFVARALDDRAGTTALLEALSTLDPDVLPARVIFAWSVGEEIGLFGAEAMARRFGASTRRIYSVDTFVTSDTPLETPHFAYTPLGAGPVLRAIENSGVSPDAERDRVREAATAAGIPLQIGLTQGGTDGTRFTFRGAPNQGLSWPGRYSHSPGEVLDLRDLAHLVELIRAMVMVGD